MPTGDETADNIVLFWRPAAPWRAGAAYRYRYRLHWRDDAPAAVPGIGRVVATRTGATRVGERTDETAALCGGLRRGRGATTAQARLTMSPGDASAVRVEALPGDAGGLRASFDVAPRRPPASPSCASRSPTTTRDGPVAETWLDRLAA